jgi:hypothetical protein
MPIGISPVPLKPGTTDTKRAEMDVIPGARPIPSRCPLRAGIDR